MKKVLMAGILCLALMSFVSTAYADYVVCGRINLAQYIKLYPSGPIDNSGTNNGNDLIRDVPLKPCELIVNFQYQAPSEKKPNTNPVQDFLIPVTAFGTQINLALLKAFNWKENISACILVTGWAPFTATITEIDFDDLSFPKI